MNCESCYSEITRNDRTAKCPRCGRWRCVHCDVIGLPCVVCRNELYCKSKRADSGEDGKGEDLI